jgi:hypothetical protein
MKETENIEIRKEPQVPRVHSPGNKTPDRRENFSNNSNTTKEMRKLNINAPQFRKFRTNHIKTAKYNP